MIHDILMHISRVFSLIFSLSTKDLLGSTNKNYQLNIFQNVVCSMYMYIIQKKSSLKANLFGKIFNKN